jgi:hypothetical protein
MGQKIKPRHSKQPKHFRNWEARDMILQGTGRSQVFRDRRARRISEKKDWQNDCEA